ncbi:MAG TPA: XamI family restriction endonuclease [Acidobacteriaceae bacterium]
MIEAPRWTETQLTQGLDKAKELFRQERIEEHLEAYLEAFELYQGTVEDLLETSVDLVQLDQRSIDILTDPALLKAFRYLTGPPVSEDDLKVLAEAFLSPSRLRRDKDMASRVLSVIGLGLDKRRFPWISENRDPTEAERQAAVLASAALMASSHVSTSRRSEGKDKQELLVEDALKKIGWRKVATRKVDTSNQAPLPGEFCRESTLGIRKADFLVGLRDHRVMAMECKVSNSSTNSVKRLNNDAAVKAVDWIEQFGTQNVVPVAVLSGVYKLHNLTNAQNRGLTLFWAHDLPELMKWIEKAV